MSSTRNPSRVQLARSQHPGHLRPNDQVLTPRRARHPISSPVTGEPAGARSVNRSPKGPGSVSADPPAAAAAEPPTEGPAELIRFRRRFIREWRAAAAVDDPHIIPVYEAG